MTNHRRYAIVLDGSTFVDVNGQTIFDFDTATRERDGFAQAFPDATYEIVRLAFLAPGQAR